MPRYYALNTAVNLCVWDPNPRERNNKESEMTKGLGTPFASTHDGIAHPKKETYGPAAQCVVDVLKEEYFEGKEGLDFLDIAVPFYLVKAGRELFAPAKAEEVQLPSDGPKNKGMGETSPEVLANNMSKALDQDRQPSSSVAEFFTPNVESSNAAEQSERGKNQGELRVT